MEITKIDEGNYVIHQNVGGIKKKCSFIIPEIIAPFGVEVFNNVEYLNFAIDKDVPYHRQLLFDIERTEKYMENYLRRQGVDAEWLPALRKNDRFDVLWKTRLPKRRGRYETQFRVDDKLGIKEDIDFKRAMSVTVTAYSIWVFKGKAGIVYSVDEINQSNTK